ncbi:MAG TPA: hypothetical protein VMF60_09300, partial [Acidimicrobiales bacterium]|nr:hypothetical protein [Acidimicrobiales bacterium]
MATDLLAEAVWACCATTAGAAETPDELDALGVEWVPAPVPGTVAGALVAAGRSVAGLETDTSDWWYCCRLPSGGEGRWTLTFEGLATVADAWFRGAHVLHAENMFVARSVELEAVAGDDELVLRFGALAPLLAARRPRPRWKTHMADHQGLRWFRTTLLGRQPGWAETPAPVGPWRPVRLEPAGPRLRRRRVAAVCVDADGGTEGVVSVSVRVAGLDAVPGAGHPGSARLRVAAPGVPGPEGEVAGPLSARAEGDEVVVEGELVVPGVARWWPHTHGAQPLYALDLEVGGRRLALGRGGFRTVRVDRAGGAFTVVVNGEAVFCRGACWWPVDPVRLHCDDDELRRSLELVRGAHMNMVRIPGGTVYE